MLTEDWAQSGHMTTRIASFFVRASAKKYLTRGCGGQVFDHDQLRSPKFRSVLDLIENLTDDVNAHAPRPDFFEGAAFDGFGIAGLAVVAKDNPELVVLECEMKPHRPAFVVVGVTDNVRAGLIDGKDKNSGCVFVKATIFEEGKGGMTHLLEVAGFAGEENAFFHARPLARMVRSSLWAPLPR